MIDTDLRGKPTFYFMVFLLVCSSLGVFFAITSYRFGFPVEPNGALGLGAIIVSTTFGPLIAFVKRRREMFQLYGNDRTKRPTHGTMPKDWKDE
ncbi:MAG: hypothetical protein ACHQW9_00030 [Nitrososphaerales archaeon]